MSKSDMLMVLLFDTGRPAKLGDNQGGKPRRGVITTGQKGNQPSEEAPRPAYHRKLVDWA